MSELERVIATGNRGHSDFRDSMITCADGFSVSVIAGGGTYCTPRPVMCTCAFDLGKNRSIPQPYGNQVQHDFPGPYIRVELGFPSERPEPWDGWKEYVEGGEDWDGVYPFVPVQMVRDLIALHGGEKP